VSARPALRVIDGNGEVVETTSVEQENIALRTALTRAENVIKGLRGQLADERKKARQTYPIDAVFTDWQAKLVAAGLKGKAQCKLSNDRVDAIRKMFEAGYTFGDFELVNTGLAACQFVRYGKRYERGAEADRDVDLVTVCKLAKRFEEAARIGAVVKKAAEAVA
jgi:hypothetical protein